MTRFILWTLGGLLFGLMIHLVVILNLPHFASHDLWNRMATRTEPGEIVLLDAVAAGSDNPLGLDPAFAVAVCRLDLSDGPGMVYGQLPDAFWSVSVFDTDGIAVFSTTHRAAADNTLNLGIFSPAQTYLLAERDIADLGDLLVVESKGNDIFITVRLAPPHAALLESYRDTLKDLFCRNLPV